MARKPAHLTASAPQPEGRDVIWAAIRKLGTFTVLDLEGETRIKEATIRTYLTGLERARYLARIEDAPGTVPGAFRRARWALINNTGAEAPRVTRRGETVTQGRPREQMWRTMRMMGEFDARDLAIHASTEDHPVSEADARHYTRYLHLAGYLVIRQPAKPGNRPGTGRLARYQLLASRYTGPQPPQIQRVRQVWDPNLGRVVWPRGGEQ